MPHRRRGRLVSSPRVRLLIAALPRLMCDILTGLLNRRPEVDFVGYPEPGEAVRAAAQRASATLIVVPREAWGPGRIRRLLRAVPRARVVTLSLDGREAAVYRLVLKQKVLQDVSPDVLLDEITRRVRRAPRR
jgi:DNA-binding NarL/FixJ family response regulator